MVKGLGKLAVAAVAAAALGSGGAAAHESETAVEQCNGIFCMGEKLRAKIHELTKYDEKGDDHKHKGFKLRFVFDDVVDDEDGQARPSHNVICILSAVYVKVPGKKEVKFEKKDFNDGEFTIAHCIDPQ
jgi:hypothetical protein